MRIPHIVCCEYAACKK